jgi:hypothetical protein
MEAREAAQLLARGGQVDGWTGGRSSLCHPCSVIPDLSHPQSPTAVIPQSPPVTPGLSSLSHPCSVIPQSPLLSSLCHPCSVIPGLSPLSHPCSVIPQSPTQSPLSALHINTLTSPSSTTLMTANFQLLSAAWRTSVNMPVARPPPQAWTRLRLDRYHTRHGQV